MRTPTFRGPHKIFVGPEMYYTERSRRGGKQDGLLSGFRAGYDHIRRCSFYWALEGYYARGSISGKSGKGDRMKSDKTDREVEGRFGYTWKRNLCLPIYFTPYVGYGYFYGINRFKPPSLMMVHFHNHFDYYAAGIQTQAMVTPRFSVGFNYKSKWMNEGKSKVTCDPKYDHVKLIMNNKRHYEYEVPITYKFCFKNRELDGSVVPFYRIRYYGGRENYPFDFYKTKFRSKGARLVLNFIF